MVLKPIIPAVFEYKKANPSFVCLSAFILDLAGICFVHHLNVGLLFREFGPFFRIVMYLFLLSPYLTTEWGLWYKCPLCVCSQTNGFCSCFSFFDSLVVWYPLSTLNLPKTLMINWQGRKYHAAFHHNITRVLWKVLGLTMKKRIYNFKIICIFQHNLP